MAMSYLFHIALLLTMQPTSLSMRTSIAAVVEKFKDKGRVGSSTATFSYSNLSMSAEALAEGASLLQEGHMFLGKFKLLKRLEDFPRYPDIRDAENREWQSPRMLGRGSFGEAWEASGVVDMPGGSPQFKTIVLKIFYKKAGGQIIYLTKNGVDSDLRRDGYGSADQCLTGGLADPPKVCRELISVKRECDVVRDINAVARAKNDLGADRLVDCFGTFYGEGDEPMYVILANGGMSLMKWVNEKGAAPGAARGFSEAHFMEARTILANLLQGVRTMSEIHEEFKMSHHDLKPDNSVVDTATGKGALIDFGALMEATPGNEFNRAVGTPAYAAPEYAGLQGRSKAFDPNAHPSSYDIFALGMMYIELMCPSLSITDPDFMVIVKRARSQFKSEPEDAFNEAGVVCNMPKEEIQLADWMMHWRATRRPKPDEVLLEMKKMFGNAWWRSIGEQDCSGSACENRFNREKVDGSWGLELEGSFRQSIKNMGAVQEQRKLDENGLFDAAEAQRKLATRQWTMGYQCRRMGYPEKSTANKQGSEYPMEYSDLGKDRSFRSACLKKCFTWWMNNREYVAGEAKKYDSKELCCELSYDYPRDGDHVCGAGMFSNADNPAEVVTLKKGGKYAILMSYDEAPFAKIQHRELCKETVKAKAKTRKGFIGGQEVWEKDKVQVKRSSGEWVNGWIDQIHSDCEVTVKYDPGDGEYTKRIALDELDNLRPRE